MSAWTDWVTHVVVFSDVVSVMDELRLCDAALVYWVGQVLEGDIDWAIDRAEPLLVRVNTMGRYVRERCW